MNILYLSCDTGIPVFGRKGCSTHVRETCRTLASRGHNVVVASPFPGPDRPAHKDYRFFKLPQVSKRIPGSDFRHLLNNLLMYRAVRDLLKAFPAEAIYERHALYSFVGAWLERRLLLPRVVEVNTRLAVENRNRLKAPWLADRAEKRIFLNARRLIVISKPLQDFMVEIGKPQRSVEIIPIGVDPDLFNPLIDGKFTRRRLGFTDDDIVIGYLGAFNYYHRFDLMYPLMQRLAADGFPVKVMAVGGVARKIEKHRRKTERMGLGNRFHFTGSVPYEDLPQYIAAMDFTVVPGHTRVATPTKIFEFGAMGKACVAPDYEPIRALMPGKAGDLIFTPEDIDSLYKRVRILLDHPEQREELGTSLRDNILANHTWDRHIDQILKIFEQMT